jgi:hypothetical protein
MNINTPRFSYDEYTRYLHNLNCYYGRINRKAQVAASLVDMGKDRRQHTLRVYIAGVAQKLSPSQKEVVRDLSSRCSCENERSWIVLDTSLDVIYMSTLLPKWWISDMLPYIKKDDEYIRDGFLFWNASIVERTCLWAEERICDRRYYQILKQLLSLYKKGSIVTVDAKFAEKWQLKEDMYSGVYHPTWWNTLLTQDPTKYLYDVLESDKPMPLSYNEALTLLYDDGKYSGIIKS